MEKNNIISEKELNKILNLIESKHSELIMEQNDARKIADNIYASLRSASSGPNTNEDTLLKAIQQINSLQLYNAVNGLMNQKPIEGTYTSIIKLLNGELGNGDVKVATQIKQALAKIGKNITFQGNTLDIVPNSFKITGTATATSPLNLDPMAREQAWQTTFSCVTKQPGAKAYTLKDGTTAYNLNGIFYYNTGRKKLADGTMANYSCTTEFKTGGSSTIVKKKSNLGSRFAKSTQSLGIQNGKMDVATLQKILTSLEGSAPKAKTASDFAPQGVPQDAFNQQAPPTDNELA